MVIASEKVKFFEKYKYQLLATLAVNTIGFSHGHATAWLAPALVLLQSEKSPLESGAVTVEEASWLGSLVCFGGFIGNFVFGTLVDKIGLKKSFYLLLIPHMCFWLTLIFGVNVTHLYIARIVGGMTGGGVFVLIPTFVADIADNKIRGLLGSTFILIFNCGLLSGFICGSFLSYTMFPRVLIALPILFIISMSRLPDTPQYYLKANKEEEAVKSLRFYRNFKGATKEEILEFNEHLNNLKKRYGNANCEAGTKLSFKDFLEPQALRGISIGVALMIVNQFGGLYALITYTSNIFQQSGSTLDANTSTIIVGAIQLLGTCVAAFLVDRIGRKPLLIVSACGVAIGLFALGLFSFLSLSQDVTHFSWIAVTSMSFAILLASFGVLPLPFVVLSEVLPQKVKAVGVTFCMCLLSVLAFIVLKVYPLLMVSIGIHGVMWVGAGFTTFGAIFICMFIPETKGKCLEKSDETK